MSKSKTKRAGQTSTIQAGKAFIDVQVKECCRACGSHRRGPDLHTELQEFAGETPTGQPYTHVRKTRVACADCGQHRIVRTYENQPPATPQRSRRQRR